MYARSAAEPSELPSSIGSSSAAAVHSRLIDHALVEISNFKLKGYDFVV